MDEGRLVGGNTAVSETLSAKAKKSSAIGNESGNMSKAVAILQDEVNMLADALQPALTPTAPTDRADDGQPMPPQSDLANFINREAEKVAKVAMMVRDLRNRVEL